MTFVEQPNPHNPLPIEFSRAVRKMDGEPCYLLEHENGKWVNPDFTALTDDANSAWYTFSKREAEDVIKFWSFIGIELPITVTEHIFTDK